MKLLKFGFALALALAAAGCAKPKAGNPPPPPRTVSVTRVEMRTLAGGLETTGLLVSREEAAVYAESPLAGYRVAKVFVEPNARVALGQPLAQLDDTLLRSQIAQQTALVAQQEVAAEQAAEQAQDVAGLEGQGVLSTEQINTRKFQARSARAQLAAQQASLRDLQTREQRMTIRAPVGGLVLTRNVRPGDVAGGGANPMFTMARDSLVELEAQVAEGDLPGIKPGDAVQVSTPDGAQIPGVVRLVYPAVDPQTKLGRVRVSLPVRPDLRPGGFGRATFTGLHRTVLAAPETAVRYEADGASMMVVDAKNHVSQVSVETGAHSGGYVEVVRGPPANARVLMGGSTFVLPGDEVKPQEVAGPAPVSAAASPTSNSPSSAPPAAREGVSLRGGGSLTPPGGGYLAQVGAFQTEAGAERAWAELGQRFPAQMQGRQRRVQRSPGGVRVYAASFSGPADAAAFCAALKAKGQGCLANNVASPVQDVP